MINYNLKEMFEYFADDDTFLTEEPYDSRVCFLTDFIDGDNYFNIHHEFHNLQRTRAQGSGLRVQGSGLRAQGSGFRVQGSGFRVQGSGFRVQGSG